MNDQISAELGAALERFRPFLLSDDSERADVIESAERSELDALAVGVEPHFDEINAVLDRLTDAAHPLPDDQEQLESDLHSLAQAGMEARMRLDG